ncbi:hypothetical protein Q7P35_007148 [Cladosporium inversicolor]
MVTRMDLRVHTTAPSSKKDDERFVAQAEAYASFAVKRKLASIPDDGSRDLPLFQQPDLVPTNMILESERTPQQPVGELTELAYDPTTFLDETQLGYTALESQLFAPSARISSTVSKQPIRLGEDRSTEVSKPESDLPVPNDSRQDGSSSSHQVPSQSSYLKSPNLDRSKKRPRINDENLQFFSTRNSSLPPVIPSREDVSHANESLDASLPSQRHISHQADNSESIDDVTSELPTSYSLSDITSVSSKGRQHSIRRSVSDPGPSPPEATESVQARPGPAPPPIPESPPKDVAGASEYAAPVIEPARPAPLGSSNSGTVVKDFATANNTQRQIYDDGVRSQDHSDLPASIRPPAPQPSLQRFETHVTESLRYLAENTSLAQCYKPVFVSRDITQSERGYWAFDITPWPAQLRLDFFQFLAKMIEPGRVGWGVWCTRELAALEVRVYCWGEVAKHVYLMLYVASKSKVRKLGLNWVDADGEVVVQMRGADAVDLKDAA